MSVRVMAYKVGKSVESLMNDLPFTNKVEKHCLEMGPRENLSTVRKLLRIIY